MLFTLFIWWLTLAVLCLAGWALLQALGWKEGVALLSWGRPVGLLSLGWLTWLLGHVVSVPMALGLSLSTLLVGGGWAIWKHRSAWSVTLHVHWRELLTGEVLFLAAAAWVAFTRSRMPGAVHTEQPMDMAFLASCIRAERMPPADPWLAGEPISYYYLGYLLWGLPARLTGTAPTVAYNLALAGTAGLAVQALYGLLWTLLLQSKARHLWSAAGAAAILAMGNLVMAVEALHALGVLPEAMARWLGVPGLAEAPVTGSPLPVGDWWWRATRPWIDSALPGRNGTIIAEFPAFSLALADLHPHLMAMPFSMAAAGLALSADTGRGRWLRATALGWLIGGAAFINGWELPSMLALTLLMLLLWARGRVLSWSLTAGMAAVTVAAAIVPYAPFWLTLDTQVSGLRVAWFAKTPLRSYLLVFGAWLLPALAWLLAEQRPVRRLWGWWAGMIVAPAIVVLLADGVGALALSVVSVEQGAPLGLALSFALAWCASRLWNRPTDQAAQPVLVLFVGLGLTYACEVLFLGDLFGTRMNTVFKLYYQAWWLLGTAAVLAMAALMRGHSLQRAVAWAMLALWALLATYPLLTAPQGAACSLDALVTIGQDERGAVAWLRNHAGEADVLLAAPGVAYDASSSNLATLSGVPTVLGWPQHERQWGRSDALLATRQRDIATIYQTTDAGQRQSLLRRYGVTWVVLGPVEGALYGEGTLVADRWRPWCAPAYMAERLTLLHCKP